MRHFQNQDFVVGRQYEAQLSKTLLPKISAVDLQKLADRFKPSSSCTVKAISHKRQVLLLPATHSATDLVAVAVTTSQGFSGCNNFYDIMNRLSLYCLHGRLQHFTQDCSYNKLSYKLLYPNTSRSLISARPLVAESLGCYKLLSKLWYLAMLPTPRLCLE